MNHFLDFFAVGAYPEENIHIIRPKLFSYSRLTYCYLVDYQSGVFQKNGKIYHDIPPMC
jgi:hypothetical protein